MKWMVYDLTTSMTLCSAQEYFPSSSKEIDHATQISLPAGDTVSPTTLGSEAHTNTQHTVTGECVHSCGTSE